MAVKPNTSSDEGDDSQDTQAPAPAPQTPRTVARQPRSQKKAYQVMAGTHWEDGVAYRQGEVVESEKPLSVLFMNKFRALDPDASDRPERKVVVDGGRTGATSAPVDQSSTTRSAGGHQAWDDEVGPGTKLEGEPNLHDVTEPPNTPSEDNEGGVVKTPKAVRPQASGKKTT
jgi:hypothetical protein